MSRKTNRRQRRTAPRLSGFSRLVNDMRSGHEAFRQPCLLAPQRTGWPNNVREIEIKLDDSSCNHGHGRSSRSPNVCKVVELQSLRELIGNHGSSLPGGQNRYRYDHIGRLTSPLLTSRRESLDMDMRGPSRRIREDDVSLVLASLVLPHFRCSER